MADLECIELVVLSVDAQLDLAVRAATECANDDVFVDDLVAFGIAPTLDLARVLGLESGRRGWEGCRHLLAELRLHIGLVLGLLHERRQHLYGGELARFVARWLGVAARGRRRCGRVRLVARTGLGRIARAVGCR